MPEIDLLKDWSPRDRSGVKYPISLSIQELISDAGLTMEAELWQPGDFDD